MDLKYSKLPSDIQASKRAQLKSMMDDFCTFAFDGLNMGDVYGAFIINDKNSLKIYNGPGFSNDYTKPQFANYTQLAGVTFKTQQIKFKVGLYYIRMDEEREININGSTVKMNTGYRNFLNHINPLKIGNLSFSFNKNGCYQVKLASIQDSTRYILDRIGNDYYYYTELDLTWEIQGEACARSILPWKFDSSISTDKTQLTFIPNDTSGITNDLSTSFTCNFTLDTTDQEMPFDVTITAYYGNLSHVLARFTLVEGTTDSQPDEDNNNNSNDNTMTLYPIHLTYNSMSGTIYYRYGNEQGKILTALNTTQSGNKMVRNLFINKFAIPGKLEVPDFDENQFRIEISVLHEGNTIAVFGGAEQPSFECYKHTNVF